MDARLRGGLLALAAVLAAGGARAQALPEGVTPAMVAEGRKLFEGRALCAGCHGRDARGLVGPNLTDADWWHSDGSYAAIVDQVRRGVPAAAARTGTPMPPKGGAALSDGDLRAVAAYVHSLRITTTGGVPADSPGGFAAAAGQAGHRHHRAHPAGPGPDRGAHHCPARAAAGCPAPGTGRGGNGPCRI